MRDFIFCLVFSAILHSSKQYADVKHILGSGGGGSGTYGASGSYSQASSSASSSSSSFLSSGTFSTSGGGCNTGKCPGSPPGNPVPSTGCSSSVPCKPNSNTGLGLDAGQSNAGNIGSGSSYGGSGAINSGHSGSYLPGSAGKATLVLGNGCNTRGCGNGQLGGSSGTSTGSFTGAGSYGTPGSAGKATLDHGNGCGPHGCGVAQQVSAFGTSSSGTGGTSGSGSYGSPGSAGKATLGHATGCGPHGCGNVQQGGGFSASGTNTGSYTGTTSGSGSYGSSETAGKPTFGHGTGCGVHGCGAGQQGSEFGAPATSSGSFIGSTSGSGSYGSPGSAGKATLGHGTGCGPHGCGDDQQGSGFGAYGTNTASFFGSTSGPGSYGSPGSAGKPSLGHGSWCGPRGCGTVHQGGGFSASGTNTGSYTGTTSGSGSYGITGTPSKATLGHGSTSYGYVPSYSSPGSAGQGSSGHSYTGVGSGSQTATVGSYGQASSDKSVLGYGAVSKDQLWQDNDCGTNCGSESTGNVGTNVDSGSYGHISGSSGKTPDYGTVGKTPGPSSGCLTSNCGSGQYGSGFSGAGSASGSFSASSAASGSQSSTHSDQGSYGTYPSGRYPSSIGYGNYDKAPGSGNYGETITSYGSAGEGYGSHNGKHHGHHGNKQHGHYPHSDTAGPSVPDIYGPSSVGSSNYPGSDSSKGGSILVTDIALVGSGSGTHSNTYGTSGSGSHTTSYGTKPVSSGKPVGSYLSSSYGHQPHSPGASGASANAGSNSYAGAGAHSIGSSGCRTIRCAPKESSSQYGGAEEPGSNLNGRKNRQIGFVSSENGADDLVMEASLKWVSKIQKPDEKSTPECYKTANRNLIHQSSLGHNEPIPFYSSKHDPPNPRPISYGPTSYGQINHGPPNYTRPGHRFNPIHPMVKSNGYSPPRYGSFSSASYPYETTINDLTPSSGYPQPLPPTGMPSIDLRPAGLDWQQNSYTGPNSYHLPPAVFNSRKSISPLHTYSSRSSEYFTSNNRKRYRGYRQPDSEQPKRGFNEENCICNPNSNNMANQQYWKSRQIRQFEPNGNKNCHCTSYPPPPAMLGYPQLPSIPGYPQISSIPENPQGYYAFPYGLPGKPLNPNRYNNPGGKIPAFSKGKPSGTTNGNWNRNIVGPESKKIFENFSDDETEDENPTGSDYERLSGAFGGSAEEEKRRSFDNVYIGAADAGRWWKKAEKSGTFSGTPNRNKGVNTGNRWWENGGDLDEQGTRNTGAYTASHSSSASSAKSFASSSSYSHSESSAHAY